MKPIVCVFAHPDDEAMGPGGTIAKFAAEREVYLVCVNSGNGLENKNPEETAKIRRQELESSAKILGVKQVEFLDFNDGELNNNSYHKLAAAVEEKVRQFQPDTLLTFNINGVTGHLDHIAVSLATSLVFRKVDFVKTLLYYTETVEMLQEFEKDYFVFVPKGYSESEVDLKIDIKDNIDKKIQAIKAHSSQSQDGERVIARLSRNQEENEYFLKLEK